MGQTPIDADWPQRPPMQVGRRERLGSESPRRSKHPVAHVAASRRLAGVADQASRNEKDSPLVAVKMKTNVLRFGAIESTPKAVAIISLTDQLVADPDGHQSPMTCAPTFSAAYPIECVALTETCRVQTSRTSCSHRAARQRQTLASATGARCAPKPSRPASSPITETPRDVHNHGSRWKACRQPLAVRHVIDRVTPY